MAPTEPQPGSGRVSDRDPTNPPPTTATCGCACDGCAMGAADPNSEPTPAAYRGWSLVAMAAFYFLLPVIAALVGATLAGPTQDSRALAGLGCFALGLAVTVGAARLLTSRSHAKENQDG